MTARDSQVQQRTTSGRGMPPVACVRVRVRVRRFAHARARARARTDTGGSGRGGEGANAVNVGSLVCRLKKAIMQMIHGRPEEGIRPRRKEQGRNVEAGGRRRGRGGRGSGRFGHPLLARYRIVTRTFTRRPRSPAARRAD